MHTSASIPQHSYLDVHTLASIPQHPCCPRPCICLRDKLLARIRAVPDDRLLIESDQDSPDRIDDGLERILAIVQARFEGGWEGGTNDGLERILDMSRGMGYIYGWRRGLEGESF
jgi:hypothetical protein